MKPLEYGTHEFHLDRAEREFEQARGTADEEFSRRNLEYWRNATPRTFLYFIQAGEGGPIKIGYSSNPNKRLVELQVGNPVELKMLAAIEFPLEGAISCEQSWHTIYEKIRMRGEWFKPHPHLLHSIHCIKNDIDMGNVEPLEPNLP